MATAQKLQPFSGQTILPAELINDNGSQAQIYRVNEGYVAKVFRNKEWAVDSCDHEYRIMRTLFDEGLPVPNPVGVHQVRIPYLNRQDSKYRTKSGNVLLPALVMEEVEGKTLRELILSGNLTNLRHITSKIYEAHKIATQMGFIPADSGDHNVIIKPNGEICLIDFRDWQIFGGN
jgi:RIO-like serine/threonine protein kinase